MMSGLFAYIDTMLANIDYIRHSIVKKKILYLLHIPFSHAQLHNGPLGLRDTFVR